MDKAKLIKQIADLIAEDLGVLTRAAHAAHEAAIHTESKAEDQYDTRGLEASYLAGAQSKRAMELEASLTQYRNIAIKSFSTADPIASTAVIELNSDEQKSYYLMMPSGGGRQIQFEGKTIHVITPQSPLGEALLGKHVGDEIEIEIKRAWRDYEVKQVW